MDKLSCLQDHINSTVFETMQKEMVATNKVNNFSGKKGKAYQLLIDAVNQGKKNIKKVPLLLVPECMEIMQKNAETSWALIIKKWANRVVQKIGSSITIAEGNVKVLKRKMDNVDAFTGNMPDKTEKDRIHKLIANEIAIDTIETYFQGKELLDNIRKVYDKFVSLST